MRHHIQATHRQLLLTSSPPLKPARPPAKSPSPTHNMKTMILLLGLALLAEAAQDSQTDPGPIPSQLWPGSK